MKILYLECKMGIAGDMMASALIDLFDDKEKMVGRLNDLSVPHVKYYLERTKRCGIEGTHLRVLIDGKEEKSFRVWSKSRESLPSERRGSIIIIRE